MSKFRRSDWLVIALALAVPAFAQRKLETLEYARAEKFMSYNTAPLVMGAVTRTTWISNDRFWYRTNQGTGETAVLVDLAKGTSEPAFDASKLPDALRAFDTEISPDGQWVTFTSKGKRTRCGRDGSGCAPASAAASRNEVVSPDGKLAAFVRAYNLWIRELPGGRETQLTTDGVKDFGYATDNAGWAKSERPILLWSPDSKKIATFQQDQRGVGEMYLVDTRVGHPKLEAWKYPLPGDDVVTTIQRVIVNVDGPRVVRLQMAADQHRSTLCDHVICRGSEWTDVQWSPDSKRLTFVSTSRDHKRENFRVADAATGEVGSVLEEAVPTYFESGNGRVNWRALPTSNEAIWFSEKSNWGHLYLHDLATGRLKNAITSGEWNVTQLLRVDEEKRIAYFLGVGREKGRDPYFTHLYRVGLDGTSLTLLSPEDGNHEISLSPSGAYFVDIYSKPDVPPVTVVRDASGKLLRTAEKADISKLLATGWKPPVPFTVKARDKVTDLYGLLFRPTNFDPSKKYPIVNHIYPGPQTGSVGSRSFVPSRGDTQALAELGFIVVELDGMGTPWRSKKFHDAYFGDLGDNTLPDQVAGMKELAARYPWIDLEKAGVYGHSGGGYAAADAMFRYPDFFKVGISEAGNHDNRLYEDDWAEKWMGLLDQQPASKANYDSQANQLVAKNLKGHLLLAHGTMDANVPPYNTLLVVDELIKANKDFDLILLPNRGHGFGNEPYMVRRRWDYFVKHLLGAEPPQGYALRPPPSGR